MFEEHVIITDIPLEENQGEVLGGGAGACCSFQNVGEGFPTLRSSEGGRKDSGYGLWAVLGLRAGLGRGL